MRLQTKAVGLTLVEHVSLMECTFTGNVADRGGGGALFGGTATLTDCTSTGNESKDYDADGSGASFGGTATLTDCVPSKTTVQIQMAVGLTLVGVGLHTLTSGDLSRAIRQGLAVGLSLLEEPR